MVLAPYPWLKQAAETLSALSSKMPNAILIHGAPGCGGWDLARNFAESLLCESPREDGSPCGECAGCHLVRAGTHPDLRFVVSEAFAAANDLPYTPADNETTDKKKKSREIRIHQFRTLMEFMAMTPHRGGWRVVLIYPADMIRAEAAASILKTLEEPSQGLVFILVADDIDGVLPTIRSRSRLVRLARPSHDEALAWLNAQPGVTDAEQALALAGGSPLEALHADDGMTLPDTAQAGVLTLLKLGGRLSLDRILAVYSLEIQPPALALFLSRWAYDLVRVKLGTSPRYFIGEEKALEALSSNAMLEALLAWQKTVGEMRRSAEHPLAPAQVFESIMIAYAMAFKDH